MSQPKYGLVAVGNALVDVLAHVSEESLQEQCSKHNIQKGTMTLIEQDRALELSNWLADTITSSGGSAGNTMAGYASLGGKGGFIGKTANDDLGARFSEDLIGMGLVYTTQPLLFGESTGRCMVMITPDAQRTMNTYLGASVEIKDTDIDADLITNAQITYLEGYLFDRDAAKHAFIKSAEIAHQAGHRIALTLSDPFCVDRHRDDFLKLIEHHVDILFANEEEIKSLYQLDNFEDAANAVSQHVEIAVLTRGEHGAIIRNRADIYAVDAYAVEKVVDTTGAGDLFASGFLYGYSQGMPLDLCGKLGAMAAAEVISHVGPRPQRSLREMAIEYRLIEDV